MRLCSQIILLNPPQSVLGPEVINKAPTLECYVSQYKDLRLSMDASSMNLPSKRYKYFLLHTLLPRRPFPQAVFANVTQSEERHLRKPLHPNLL